MARIVVTDPLAQEGLDLLKEAGHEVVRCQADDAAVARADAWIVRSGTMIGPAQLDQAPGLRCIGRAGVGVDNIDLEAATARGVAVFNAPTGNITSAAEQAWALMLAVARRVPEADASMKRGEWLRKGLRGTELHGKTLLVVGLGRIGAMMVERGRAFGMEVLGHDPFVAAEQARAMGADWVPIEEGLGRADVVSLHTPLTPRTKDLIDSEALACMKEGAILVNAARGGLVDPQALLEALDSGRLAGAGIDVWPEEPPTDWDLARHPRVVAAPHLGASTQEAQVKAALQACGRVAAFLSSGDAGLAVNARVRVPEAMRPWTALVEALAGFAVQVLDGSLEEVSVRGDPDLDLEALRVHALVGSLRAGIEEPVNAINAVQRAQAQGWHVESHALEKAEVPHVRVEVRSDAGSVALEGTTTQHYGPRVTRLDSYDVEFRPEGRFLFTRHDDVPGVLAAIAAVLAESSVNVASVSLARDRRAGNAVAVIQVDGSIPRAARDALRRVAAVREAHRIRLW